MLPASVARFRIWTAPDDGRRLGQRQEFAPDPRVGGDVGHHRPRPDREPCRRRSRISPSSSAIRLRSTTTRGWIDPSRSRMIRSVPPASSRASVPASPSRATASSERGRSLVGEGSHRPGLEHPIHLVEQHLRRRRPDEEVRPLGEPPDEVGPRRAERIGVDHRHREARAPAAR